MKYTIEDKDLESVIDLCIRFPLHTLNYDEHRKKLVFKTLLSGGYTHFFDVEVS